MKLDSRAVAHALGGEVAGRNTVLAPGPGHSKIDRSLSILIDPKAPDGFVVDSFAGDDWRDCRDHVRQRLGLPAWQPGDEQDRRIKPARVKAWDAACVDAEADSRRPRTEDELLRIERARGIWDEAGNPRVSYVMAYFASRHLDLPDSLCGSVLRFHARCPWRNENTGRTDRVPALIAAFRSIDDDTITAIHRIVPRAGGPKADRKMLGVVARAAVKLGGLTGDTLTIGEGIETCMAAQELGIKPAWALGSVGAISFFPVLDGIEKLKILGEAGEASAKAARVCTPRWRRAGRRVLLVMPKFGSDLNDDLIARRASK
jgi:hypothetical protein